MNYTHPKIAARIRAYLRRDTDHTPTGILRGVHKQASRIHTTLRELEANGEIYRHLSPQPGPPDTWHLTDTTHDTNPGTNATTPTETQPQPPTGPLRELVDQWRETAQATTHRTTRDDLLTVAMQLEDVLNGDQLRPFVESPYAHTPWALEHEQIEPVPGVCRCGHAAIVHAGDVGDPLGGCGLCGCDRFGRPADLEHGGEILTFAPIEGPGRLVTGVGGRRCIIDGTAGIFLEQPSGGVLHMPADGTETHVDPPGMPCRQHPLVVAIADNVDSQDPWDLPDLDRAVKVVAYLREHGGSIDELLADRSFEA